MIYQVAGGFYHNRENAHDAASELVTKDDIFEQLGYILSDREILEWCFQNDAFLEHFEEQIFDAEEGAINDLYLQKVEFFDDEEEEEFKTNVEFLDDEEE